eukprot:sb/3472057/
MRSPESYRDSGKLIRSVIRYEIWNMIRGSLLADMRHDSEEVSTLMYCSLSFPPSTSLMIGYREVLENCARRKTSARQLLGAALYSTFTKIRPVAELFIVDPNNARRLFRTYPNTLICLNIVIRSWLITVKNFMNSLKKDVFYHYVKKGTDCVTLIDVLFRVYYDVNRLGLCPL